MARKITNLTAAGALDGTELAWVEQSGGAVKATTQAIADLGGGAETKYVTSTQAVNNTTTLVDVTALSGFVLEAGEDYIIEACLAADSPAAADMDIAFQWDNASTESFYYVNTRADTAQAGRGYSDITTEAFCGTGNTSHTMVVNIEGFIRAHASGATLDFQFAQNVATVGDTTIHIGSWIRLTKIS